MKEFIKLVFKFGFVMILVIGIILGAVVVYAKMSGKEITDISGNMLGDKNEPVTVLVAGLHPDGPLTDFIMLVKYNPDTGMVNAMSIPRDTKVVGTVDGKINSAYAKGKNIENLVDKVKDITSITAEHYVIFDTKSVRKMVDAIGGIPMNVPIDMEYDDNEQNLHISLKKGYQVLDGEKAEQFIRFRKNNDGTGYAMGDIERIEAQKKFIKGAVSQVLQPSTILKLPELISLALETVKTDITLGDVLGYLEDIKNFNKNNLRIETLPGEGTYIGAVSYFVHDSAKAKQMVEELFINDTSTTTSVAENEIVVEQTIKKIDKSDISIEVLNGTSRIGLANSVAEKLKAEGYNVTKIGNYKTAVNISTSIINRKNEDYAKEIKNFLGIGKIKNEVEESSKVDVTVILGNDYK